ncbi:hypothetical protein OPT61_g4059 [Boeremia exigua]|uniref:Uncharacterized protein n=1 Tax=Boeremia exigua TaxID=749465 RepID=A0ACC2IFQ0_9PLEO|nr:hypothetical protein OPT61_g4059 [Boeremia exigua]
MPQKSRLPLPVPTKSAQSLHRLRSEADLRASSARPLRRLQSLGQLPPPPNKPLPPIPPRSPYRPQVQVQSKAPQTPSRAYTGGDYSPIAFPYSISDSRSCYSQEQDEVQEGSLPALGPLNVQDSYTPDRIDFALNHESKRTYGLDDLSQILNLRGRLQEMGTTFSPEGEILTLGNPLLDSDLEQMFRLGSMYDEQWDMFFKSGRNEAADAAIWPVLRMLKKTLQAEGIRFNDRHKLLNPEDLHAKLIRLSERYDALREEWLHESLKDVHPALRPQRSIKALPGIPKRSGLGSTPAVGDELQVRRRRQHSDRLNVVIEEQPSLHDGPSHTVSATSECNRTPSEKARLSKVAESPAPASVYSPALSTQSHALTPGLPYFAHTSTPISVPGTAGMVPRSAGLVTHRIPTATQVGRASHDRSSGARAKEETTAVSMEDEHRDTSQTDSDEDNSSPKKGRLRGWLKKAFVPKRK